MNQGITIWLTGLSGAGKTTLAELIERRLRERGIDRIEVLDGDSVRMHLSKGLGFSREDRDANILRIAYVCGLLTRNGVIAISAAISPYREARARARESIGSFLEVYVRCPLEVVVERDVKGLYQRALAGEIQHFTGISDPYEEPLDADVVVDTDRQSPEDCATTVLKALEDRGFLAPVQPANGQLHSQESAEDAYSEEEEELVTQRLKNLGYL